MSVESTPNGISPEVRRAIETPVTEWTSTEDAPAPAYRPQLNNDGTVSLRGRRLRGGRKLTKAEIAVDERIAAGEVHVVADVRMREGDCWTVCSCGERFEGDTAEETARAFNTHSAWVNKGRGYGDPWKFNW